MLHSSVLWLPLLWRMQVFLVLVTPLDLPDRPERPKEEDAAEEEEEEGEESRALAGLCLEADVPLKKEMEEEGREEGRGPERADRGDRPRPILEAMIFLAMVVILLMLSAAERGVISRVLSISFIRASGKALL